MRRGKGMKLKSEAITLKDIAKALDMSISTVSKALRDSHEISDSTKDLVNELCKKTQLPPQPYGADAAA
jgi:LacI family transcriptional regulator